MFLVLQSNSTITFMSSYLVISVSGVQVHTYILVILAWTLKSLHILIFVTFFSHQDKQVYAYESLFVEISQLKILFTARYACNIVKKVS